MRVRLLSRASHLAVLQAEMVAQALRVQHPQSEIVRVTRSSEGDRDRRSALWAMPEKGVFTADLSQALAAGEADAAVHSWKDLPVESHPGTLVAGTLERADPRDVVLVARDVIASRPATLDVLTSSPRRGWQLEMSLKPLLPWPVETITLAPVRGNIPTRLGKLIAGEGHALVVAKAALDRLLSADPSSAIAATLRAAIDQCVWMVLPLREYPTAPAQGAIAVEVPGARPDLRDAVQAITHQPTWDAVVAERAILSSFGGGCHDAIGATVLLRDYGRVTSVRARLGDAEPRDHVRWSLEPTTSGPPPAPAAQIWPRPDERERASRRPLAVSPPPGTPALWVARADALPADWRPGPDQLVWVSGSRTWQKLAARGVWVHGSADGLGDAEAPNIDALAGHAISWRRLTHTASGDPDALATYVVEQELPADLAARSHFYWTSGSAFLQAVARYPALRSGWHASGPGRTARVLRDTLDAPARISIWLDYDQWHHAVTS
ncbi:MAG: hydroxymethylbilane synthase [Acidobacteriota bacterium]